MAIIVTDRIEWFLCGTKTNFAYWQPGYVCEGECGVPVLDGHLVAAHGSRFMQDEGPKAAKTGVYLWAGSMRLYNRTAGLLIPSSKARSVRNFRWLDNNQFDKPERQLAPSYWVSHRAKIAGYPNARLPLRVMRVPGEGWYAYWGSPPLGPFPSRKDAVVAGRVACGVDA